MEVKKDDEPKKKDAEKPDIRIVYKWVPPLPWRHWIRVV